MKKIVRMRKHLNNFFNLSFILFFSFLLGCQADNTTVDSAIPTTTTSTSATETATPSATSVPTAFQQVRIKNADGSILSGATTNLALGSTLSLKAQLFSFDGTLIGDAPVSWSIKIISSVSGNAITGLSCLNNEVANCDFTPNAPGTVVIEVTMITHEANVIGYSNQTHPIVISATNIASTLDITSGQNQTGVVDSNLSQPLKVTLKDTFGRPVVGASITFAVTAGGGSLVTSNPHITDANGVASAQIKLGTTAGTSNQTITATLASPTLMQSFTASAIAGVAHHLSFSTPPASTYALLPFTTQPVIVIKDIFNNILTSNSSSIATSVQAGVGNVTGQSTKNFINGTVSFTDLAYSAADNNVILRFTSGGLTLDTSALNFVLPTGATGGTPDPVTFDWSISYIPGSAGRTASNTVTITGLTQSIGVAVSGTGNPKVRLNNGAESTSLITVNNNDHIQVLADAPTVDGNSNLVTIVLGGRTVSWELRYADPNVSIYTFVTSTSRTGGVNADIDCQTLASAAGYGDGNWVALRTFTADSMKNKFPWKWGTLRRIDGSIVANNWTDLWDGSINLPININEKGLTTNGNVWTGVWDVVSTGDMGATCGNWSSSALTDGGSIGSSSSAGNGWIKVGDNTCNTSTNYNYCYSLPTGLQDTTPNAIDFSRQITTTQGTIVLSTTNTISGLTTYVPISITAASGNPKVHINGAAIGVTNGTVGNGDHIQLEMTSPSTAGLENTATVIIGDSSFNWKVATVDAASESLIFVTSGTWTGNLGGVTGADNLCATAASTAGYGGTWKAVITQDLTLQSIQNRVPSQWAKLKRLDGKIIANSWDDLWDGSIQNTVSIDENLNTRASTNVWTGYGAAHFPGDDNCGSWHNGTGYYSGNYGNSNSTSSSWVNSGNSNIGSNFNLALYCILDPSSTPDRTPSNLSFPMDVVTSSNQSKTSTALTIKGITVPITVGLTSIDDPTAQMSILHSETLQTETVTSGSTATAYNGDQITLTMHGPSTTGNINTANIVLGDAATTWQVGYADTTKTARIFVTNNSYSSNQGGLVGVDNLCITEATLNGLTGNWKALLSDTANDARSRIPFNWGTLKRLDGVIVATSWSDLWDGTIANPISIQANGNTLTSGKIYTGSKSDGTRVGLSSTWDYFCYNWSSSYTSGVAGGNGYAGNSGLTSPGWINTSYAVGLCHVDIGAYYCVGDTPTADAIKPFPFEFNYKTYVTAGSLAVESDPVTISGLFSPAVVTIDPSSQGNAGFKINGVVGTSGVTTITNGQSLSLVMDAPGSDNQSNKMQIKVGSSAFVPWRIWSGNAASGTKKRIFITSGLYWPGNFGGISGADALCNTNAANNSNLNGSTWKALISGSKDMETTSAINRINYNWSELWTFNANGSLKDKIFNSSEIWSGGVPQNLINTDESGNVITVSQHIATNTNAKGFGISNSDKICNAFNSGSANAAITSAAFGIAGTSNWLTSTTAPTVCWSTTNYSNQTRLYCIEQ